MNLVTNSTFVWLTLISAAGLYLLDLITLCPQFCVLPYADQHCLDTLVSVYVCVRVSDW